VKTDGDHVTSSSIYRGKPCFLYSPTESIFLITINNFVFFFPKNDYPFYYRKYFQKTDGVEEEI